MRTLAIPHYSESRPVGVALKKAPSETGRGGGAIALGVVREKPSGAYIRDRHPDAGQCWPRIILSDRDGGSGAVDIQEGVERQDP